jgi:hypothetical protein
MFERHKQKMLDSAGLRPYPPYCWERVDCEAVPRRPRAAGRGGNWTAVDCRGIERTGCRGHVIDKAPLY